MKRYFSIFLGLLLVVIFSGIVGADFTEGLVNHWTFNDQKKLLVDDVGGVTFKNGGGVTFSNGMAIFNGDSRSFLYSTDPSINSERFSGTKEFTVWVKFEVDTYRGDEIIRLVRRNLKRSNSNTTFSITLCESSISGAVFKGSEFTATPPGVSFSDKESNVMAMGFSPTLLRCYGNGIERIKELEDFSMSDIGIFTVGGLVNHDDIGFSQIFIGRIDEIRIYDRLLTFEEIDAIEAVK